MCGNKGVFFKKGGNALKEGKKRSSADERRDRIVGYVTALPAFVLLSLFTVYPVLSLVWSSLFSGSLITKKRAFVGIGNYRDLMESEDFRLVLSNTFVYTLLLVVMVIVLAILIAVWLNGKKHKILNEAVQGFIFTPHIISLVSASLVFLWIMDRDSGLFNIALNFFGLPSFPFLNSPKTALFSMVLVMVWKSLGYYSLIFLAALQTIPHDIYEAAELDDTPTVRVFYKITLPMISPTILFTTVVATINSFRIFDTVSIMTQGGPVNSTNTLVYYIYQYAFKFSKIGIASAAGVIMLSFVGILTFIQFGLGGRRVHYQ
jgi:sn-glycerol 3-phosphate transport system permease protein